MAEARQAILGSASQPNTRIDQTSLLNLVIFLLEIVHFAHSPTPPLQTKCDSCFSVGLAKLQGRILSLERVPGEYNSMTFRHWCLGYFLARMSIARHHFLSSLTEQLDGMTMPDCPAAYHLDSTQQLSSFFSVGK